MASSYWVDWSDSWHPTIRPAEESDGYEELKSLKQCKLEIIERARNDRQHWLAVIHRTKALTPEKIERRSA